MHKELKFISLIYDIKQSNYKMSITNEDIDKHEN